MARLLVAARMAVPVLALLLAPLLAAPAFAETREDAADSVARGEYVARSAGCM